MSAKVTGKLATGRLTGGKVLAIALAGFGTVIAVNMLLAWKAVATFPGIETASSYQASQEFDRARAAQMALGWGVRADYGDGVLEIAITGPDGGPAEIASMAALVGWATSTRDDVTPEFTRKGAVYATPLRLEDGNWNIRLRAVAADGTAFFRRIPLPVRDGRS
ncbi:FixH family protein [Mangrovicoccus algicola]|uniref:FixH family protein n=1 Tax=Mangrovicoccus algicola TaxID=2771008 RepID=A0A8J7CUH7_9RHOB|nr:FixH family protein [Mangrovicoccus algicola]MBE3637514.1 FixH family protein [Mangrovicoccus algicola]